ncbi:hypothetical protein HPP92_002967 [Vanilla planifolia]|uniref:Uncharacterized protein n=1 Tax=Vanilla planifolia TaxID=51239 RepID=A0A835RTZ5_VANPL|nr:hypothetical protein HPP92_002967 [Vanilla planifolia]
MSSSSAAFAARSFPTLATARYGMLVVRLGSFRSNGSAKLRDFLVSPSEIASESAESSSVGTTAADQYDSGQRYIDAVNGLAISEAGGICSTDGSSSVVQLYQSFSIDSKVIGPTNVDMLTLNPPVAHLVSQAYLESHQVVYYSPLISHNRWASTGKCGCRP